MTEPITYVIDRISDLSQIPVDRRERCVHELLLALSLAELAGAELGGPMSWTDDGDPSCELLDQAGDAWLKLEARHV